MGEKPTEELEQPPVTSSRLGAGSTLSNGGGLASTRSSLPESSGATLVTAATPIAEPEDEVEDEEPAAQPVRFAYVCYHCGAHREVDSEGYVSDCSTCGQSLESGKAQMEAVARGEHVPTYDRTSKYYP